MILSVLFPMHTASENKYRRVHWAVAASKTKKQRDAVRAILGTTFERPSLVLPNGESNRFEVTLCRIAPAPLDDDNMHGAFKGIRDEVAAWLGLDDRDVRVRFRLVQQRAQRGYYGVRITVEDLVGGDERHRVVGPAPTLKGEPEERPTRKATHVKPKTQRANRLRAFAVFADKIIELKDLPADAPKTLSVKRGGVIHALERTLGQHEGETCWLYRDPAQIELPTNP